MSSMQPIMVNGREIVVDLNRLELLDAIARTGNISNACLHVGISYRTALNWLREIEQKIQGKVTQSTKGGKNRGTTVLTELGHKLLDQYYVVRSRYRPGFIKSYIEHRLSARNILTGIVKNVTEGDVISMVNVEIDPRQNVKTIITTDSLKLLDIKPGDRIAVVIKATEALLMKP